ncbi:MAG: hypothetical protein JWQ73_269 [Variovorax sp.]|nr:hypothetical protein [Variovorax sp.]
MAKTYEQIQHQIEKLQRQAAALQAVEAKGVIDRIKEAIKHYSLTADQLGFDGAKTAAIVAAPAPVPSPATKSTGNGNGNGKPQFSDQSGNVWGGRGPHPAWLREALQAGHNIREFRIGRRAKPKKTLVPLGEAIASDSPSSASTTVLAAAPRRAKVSYGDSAGHSWSGMGPKPGWLKTAIDSGKSLADFAR